MFVVVWHDRYGSAIEEEKQSWSVFCWAKQEEWRGAKHRITFFKRLPWRDRAGSRWGHCTGQAASQATEAAWRSSMHGSSLVHMSLYDNILEDVLEVPRCPFNCRQRWNVQHCGWKEEWTDSREEKCWFLVPQVSHELIRLARVHCHSFSCCCTIYDTIHFTCHCTLVEKCTYS